MGTWRSNNVTVFCMCRIVTMSLRMAWAKDQKNVKLGIAAQIFVAAGTVLLFITNLVFAQRIIRAQHPNWGWHKAFDRAFRGIILVTVLTLIMLIIVTVQSFYTLSTHTHQIDRSIQLYGTTWFTIVAFLPVPLVIVGVLLPKRIRVDKFGNGRFRTKIFVLLVASCLLTLGAGWRCGTAYMPPVPLMQPSPWYFDKAFFYVYDFGVEAIVVFLYIFVRVDRRFHVPDGAKGPGSYKKVHGRHDSEGPFILQEDMSEYAPYSEKIPMDEEKGMAGQSAPPPYYGPLRVYSEEELFDDSATLAETLNFNATSLELDRQSGKWLLKSQSQQSLYSSFSANRGSGAEYAALPSHGHTPACSSRGSDISAVYSAIEAPRAIQAPITRFNADDVRWETISMAHSHKPSADATSIAASTKRSSMHSMRSQRTGRQRGDTWSSMAEEAELRDLVKRRSLGFNGQGIESMSSVPTVASRHSTGQLAIRATPTIVNGKSPLSSEVDQNADDASMDKRNSGSSSGSGRSTPKPIDYAGRKSSWRKSVEVELRLSEDIADERAPLADLNEGEEDITDEQAKLAKSIGET